MNLNKKQLVKVLLAILISAVLAIVSVYLIIHLGQAVLQWFNSLAPRTRTWLTFAMLVIVALSTAYGIWRMRKARKQ
ncbi:hypothetical protein [Pseudoduganella sp. GCM10020061]|uniref:hypothetical protein n=1 Tax=Pseudoduganella sp. GCM10020061 TaxID=3317345 RepID=UPI00362C333D